LNSIFPRILLIFLPFDEYGSILGLLSIISNIVDAAPKAMLTEFTNGKALPTENAPAITLKNTFERNYVNEKIAFLIIY